MSISEIHEGAVGRGIETTVHHVMIDAVTMTLNEEGVMMTDEDITTNETGDTMMTAGEVGTIGATDEGDHDHGLDRGHSRLSVVATIRKTVIHMVN